MYSSRILLNQTQIEAINWKNYGRNETGLCDLSRNDLLISISALKDLFHLENLDQEPRYTREGIRYGKAFYNALKTKILDSLPGGTDSRDNLMVSPQHAVAVKNGQIRLYPTMAGSYRDNEIGELDRYAVSLLKLGEPVLLYCTDKSGLWCFIRTAQVYGWVFRDFLALEPDEIRWQQYCNNREYAVTADSRKKLNYIDFNGRRQIQTLWMGTRLPLYDVTEQNLLLGIPARDKRGNLVFQQILTKRDGGLIPGTMPMSAQNIISQAKKMLGEPYGWGGSGFRRDCTSFAADVYAVFGLLLPRNSSEQLQMYGIEHSPMETGTKKEFLAALTLGSLLYCEGHVMLYLGEEAGQMQILHNTYAIGIPANDRLIPHKIRRVVQGTLSQHRVGGETFFDAVNAIWAPDHQKRFLLCGWSSDE